MVVSLFHFSIHLYWLIHILRYKILFFWVIILAKFHYFAFNPKLTRSSSKTHHSPPKPITPLRWWRNSWIIPWDPWHWLDINIWKIVTIIKLTYDKVYISIVSDCRLLAKSHYNMVIHLIMQDFVSDLPDCMIVYGRVQGKVDILGPSVNNWYQILC